jgi:hypothetical protein
MESDLTPRINKIAEHPDLNDDVQKVFIQFLTVMDRPFAEALLTSLEEDASLIVPVAETVYSIKGVEISKVPEILYQKLQTLGAQQS